LIGEADDISSRAGLAKIIPSPVLNWPARNGDGKFPAFQGFAAIAIRPSRPEEIGNLVKCGDAFETNKLVLD
jgi:hypothetical protein